VKTVGKEARVYFEERKSKFIGSVKSVATRDEAEQFLASVRAIYPDATHHCSVYRLVEKGQEYYKTDDDGEPSGTAGKPMGDVLTRMEVGNVVLVATRYFGGIKLGAGGLIRSYARCAKMAVQEAGIRDYIEKSVWLLEIPYDKVEEVEGILREDAAEVLEKGFAENVAYKVKISPEALERLRNVKNIFLLEL
jgi:uncharacterized YigZ family protein